jgi:hypothetical protein
MPCFLKREKLVGLLMSLNSPGTGLQSAHNIRRGGRIQHGERAFMVAVDGLQIIQCFLTADFTADDARGTHPQRIVEKLADTYRSFAFDIIAAGQRRRMIQRLILLLGTAVLETAHD